MNQSRMDSLMESLVNIIIGLIISTIANFVLLGLILGYPMSFHNNVLISVVFTVISLVRSYSLRRAFNGRSVWVAIKDKYNARLSHQAHPAEGVDRTGARTSASGVPHVRMGSDIAPGHRKRSYHFWGIRKQTAR